MTVFTGWRRLSDTRLFCEKNEKNCILRSKTIDKLAVAKYNIYIIKQNKSPNTEVQVMTTRELRQMLVEVENQNMTVKELRDLLLKLRTRTQN